MVPETENLQQFIAKCAEVVDSKLDKLVPTADIEPIALHRAIRHSLFAGGKRFRPAFVFAVGNVFGVSNDKLINVAAAIEMIHTYSLIHDDLPSMDDDDLRRGRETCHKKFGEATAILAGDALQNMAFQAIVDDVGLSAETRIRLVSIIADASGTPFGMVAGQQEDLTAEGQEITIEQLEQIHRAKTGSMIRVSAQSGAIIGDAGDVEFEAITDFAENLGLLFQITDDLLDVTQSTKTLGKTAGKDISASKATYPAVYGIAESQNMAEKVHEKACRELARINKPTQLLRDVADFILHREK
ncbi:MAG: polyprenyl synthetase family protein [Pyrinomonadaceae bacterium]|nr:polyprenyl synthetase family protein [Pyrinomonadaceae bacterium]